MVEMRNRLWKYIFYGLLGLHALYQLGFGATTLVNPQSLLAFGFNPQAAPESYLVVLMLAFAQFFLTVTAILSIYWTHQGKPSGAILGISLGVYFLLLGIAGVWAVDQLVTLYIDIVRGLLTIVSGYAVFKNLKK